jgi:hypothetical protein
LSDNFSNCPFSTNFSLVILFFLFFYFLKFTNSFATLMLLVIMLSSSPIGFQLLQVRYAEIMSDSAFLDRVLAEGATKAADIADATLNNVYQAMGFSRR